MSLRDESFRTWLKQIGLRFNPFWILEAGDDPWVPAYLVGHEAFATIWGDWPSFVFAAAGGGKTAFRVRLARACRVGQDGRRLFPIVYKVPSPAALGGLPPTLEAHLGALSQATALELLLRLVYQPTRFHKLDERGQQTVRRYLDENLPGPLDHFLAQLDTAGDLTPLTVKFDPTAEHLLNPPGPSSVRQLCVALSRLPPAPPERRGAPARFTALLELILARLNFEAVYLLVDGVDAHAEVSADPRAGLKLIQPLLEQTHDWARKQLFPKYFLPLELQEPLRPLTQGIKTVTIKWTREMLIEVLHERLRVASEGMFNSFDAICTPGLRDVEAELVRAARPLPREVLMLAERLLWERFNRDGQEDSRLEPPDLDAVLKWYDTLPVSSGFSY
jgi:hypothetical protein